MKVLIVTNKVKTYALGFRNMIEPLMALGHDIVWAADFSGFVGDPQQIPCKTVSISIDSNPLKPCNLRALRKLVQIMKEEKIEALQCSTPIGGMLGRLAAKKAGVAKVIYAAHGFLFFKGASLLNRTVYKWQEVLMAPLTDVLITITDEDYQAAQNFRLRGAGKRYLVHGAGVEVGRQIAVDKTQKRKELGVPETAFVITSAGFLNKNKNNQVVIQALGRIQNPQIYYLVCGEGAQRDALIAQAEKLGLQEQVRFLGYRTDIAEIMACTDVFAMPSFREGVPRALLEAMDLGIACIGSETRGIRELLSYGEGGVLCNPTDAQAYATGIQKLYDDPQLRQKMGELNRETAKLYSKERVQAEMFEIYKAELSH